MAQLEIGVGAHVVVMRAAARGSNLDATWVSLEKHLKLHGSDQRDMTFQAAGTMFQMPFYLIVFTFGFGSRRGMHARHCQAVTE